MNASVTEPCDQVTVAFTRDQVLALFGLLQWANQRSCGLAVKGDVRDAWVQLSAAWARANPGRKPCGNQVGSTTRRTTT